MVKDSIIMTVSDREPEVLMSTLRWLRTCDLTDTEIIVVNDCSRISYEFIRKAYESDPIRWVDLEPYECYSVPAINYNNPAKAFNAGLEAAKGENVVLMSSDVIVPARVLDAARKYDTNELVYCPMTVDLASGAEYCGPMRQFPMPWFLYTSRAKCLEVGGWDENYLLGLCYEDNDFVGRLGICVGRILFDWRNVCWHQSHYQPAYQDEQWIEAANKRNQDYTLEKWAGIPFTGADMIAFGTKREIHETGHYVMVLDDIKSVYDTAVAMTRSPFKPEPEEA